MILLKIRANVSLICFIRFIFRGFEKSRVSDLRLAKDPQMKSWKKECKLVFAGILAG